MIRTPTLAKAERAYIEGLSAYDQALVEDACGHSSAVREHLRTARRWLDQAADMLENMRKKSADAAIAARLAVVKAAGRPCCGKPSLWERYQFSETGE